MTIFPRAIITDHARMRLAERSAMTECHLLGILDRGIASRVSVSKKRSHLVHRLYWSQQDERFHIAVQDIIRGTVVTVLTAKQYGEKYPGLVTERHINKALNKAILAGLACRSRWQPSIKTTGYVYAHLVSDEGIDDRPLGLWQAELAAPDVAAVGTMEQFWRWVWARLRDRRWPLESLGMVSLRLPFADDAPVPYLCGG